ncbi:16S rRNA (adenine(1518)-N(6)/adenine(1519)-N(6))-dimethyltransferase RsmA [Bifidobacterium sp. SMB2]|uniref:Ribosomal RNA small subunit methyltransferase A n=1 Tax=Bifidobacterium saimiriisciurei TaxID=2661627 RepID=A0ABX0C947_9BIFI|nr:MULTISPECIES: 16S rRNA (adenine(1518)-N(6)/adenine(1519)-N(6))-dimethyltransferase RsmA [Bifidobacterium]NEG95510.1 16S rRNA (adenine(1518)-N(6)/adenine(1519)-N(6))-dimethyltransferase RsmA [Bifidobacterium sp. SMB2]NEH11668.1 16S rRNA (adenine(1518)-N(6)/adenine(1519)-N(6))-dimethyltransferase RsmA [Bifidobacterium saimiriisciurei]
MPDKPSHASTDAADQADAETSGLLGAADIRRIAADAGVTPTKKFGQNFVIDPGTVRRIARTAEIGADDQVMEVGPGLGSLTLALLETGAAVTAVEIDPPLAERLPHTIVERMPQAAERFAVINQDALKVTPDDTPALARAESFTLVANLPYNVATPIIITLLERYPNLSSFVVMVQKEVADRLCAKPGSKIYGTPSVKLQWFGEAERAGVIGRNVFWPAPNVDSALVKFTRTHTDLTDDDIAARKRTFALVDAAFAQRRKTLHAALKKTVPASAFETAGIDATLRGETLTIDRFAALAAAAEADAA